MKIRFGLLHEYQANRFSISETVVSRKITWVKAAASVLKSYDLCFYTKNGKCFASRPLMILITPKNHTAQRITWSNCKHFTDKF